LDHLKYLELQRLRHKTLEDRNESEFRVSLARERALRGKKSVYRGTKKQLR
jgi:hypothetical protein